jgi:hypothetical protein
VLGWQAREVKVTSLIGFVVMFRFGPNQHLHTASGRCQQKWWLSRERCRPEGRGLEWPRLR